MKRAHLALAAVVLFLFTPELALAGEKGGAEAAIRVANARLKEIVLSGKADALLTDYYAPGAMLMPPNQPAIHGDDNVKAMWQGYASMGKVTLDVTAGEVKQTGETAVEIGKWTMTIEAPGAPQPMLDNGKYIVLWKRLADGKWRATHDMWSSDRAPAPAAAKQ